MLGFPSTGYQSKSPATNTFSSSLKMVHLTLANMSLGADYDRSKYQIITNNLYAGMLCAAPRLRQLFKNEMHPIIQYFHCYFFVYFENFFFKFMLHDNFGRTTNDIARRKNIRIFFHALIYNPRITRVLI